MKGYQAVNRQKFQARWAVALGDQPDPPAKFEISWGYRGRELFWEKYRANVPRFQHWWKARQERKSSTNSGRLGGDRAALLGRGSAYPTYIRFGVSL